MSQHVLHVCVWLLGTLAARPAFACSVCFVAKKENLVAFFMTGVLLSLLPLLLVGGVGLWLYRQAKARREFLPTAKTSQEKLVNPRYQLK